MDINELIAIVKKKLKSNIDLESIVIEDKSFLHKNHPGNQKDKFHIKIILKSNELKNIGKIEGYKKIYKIIDKEMKEFIHSIQILIS
jgi:BolA protein